MIPTMAADPVTLRGVPLHLFDHEAVSDAIRAAGDFYESALLDDLRDRRPHERTILDVGAHLGNHAVYWSAFVPHDAIVAMEPVPETFAILARNLAPYPTAVAYQAAANDSARVLAMQVDEVNMGRSHLEPGGDLMVAAMRIDTLGLRDVSLVKVDVEGHQARVLRGARATLAREHPALVVEDGEGLVEATLRLLGLDGYRHVAEWSGANHLWEWAA